MESEKVHDLFKMSDNEDNNILPYIDLQLDGEFVKPVSIEKSSDPNKVWYHDLNPWQRLNSHYTYSSVRRNVNFKPFHVMKDHLDLVLTTNYQHGQELFPDKIDVSLQPLTISGKKITKPIAGATKHAFLHRKQHGDHSFDMHSQFMQREPRTFREMKRFVQSRQLLKSHPLIIGGIKQRVHPSYVKLMNSSHHSPQTNAGYVRQDRDGMVFYY